jgi:hypothetical protein
VVGEFMDSTSGTARPGMTAFHRYQKMKNRLRRVCYVPAASAGLPRVSFFFSFFVAAEINSTNEANKAGSTRR